MSPFEVMVAGREMMVFALVLVTPFLLAAIAASLVVGLLQAATRINDITLGFVPRLVAVMLVIYFGAYWAGGRMIGYIERAAAATHLGPR